MNGFNKAIKKLGLNPNDITGIELPVGKNERQTQRLQYKFGQSLDWFTNEHLGDKYEKILDQFHQAAVTKLDRAVEAGILHPSLAENYRHENPTVNQSNAIHQFTNKLRDNPNYATSLKKTIETQISALDSLFTSVIKPMADQGKLDYVGDANNYKVKFYGNTPYINVGNWTKQTGENEYNWVQPVRAAMVNNNPIPFVGDYPIYRTLNVATKKGNRGISLSANDWQTSMTDAFDRLFTQNKSPLQIMQEERIKEKSGEQGDKVAPGSTMSQTANAYVAGTVKLPPNAIFDQSKDFGKSLLTGKLNPQEQSLKKSGIDYIVGVNDLAEAGFHMRQAGNTAHDSNYPALGRYAYNGTIFGGLKEHNKEIKKARVEQRATQNLMRRNALGEWEPVAYESEGNFGTEALGAPVKIGIGLSGLLIPEGQGYVNPSLKAFADVTYRIPFGSLSDDERAAFDNNLNKPMKRDDLTVNGVKIGLKNNFNEFTMTNWREEVEQVDTTTGEKKRVLVVSGVGAGNPFAVDSNGLKTFGAMSNKATEAGVDILLGSPTDWGQLMHAVLHSMPKNEFNLLAGQTMDSLQLSDDRRKALERQIIQPKTAVFNEDTLDIYQRMFSRHLKANTAIERFETVVSESTLNMLGIGKDSNSADLLGMKSMPQFVDSVTPLDNGLFKITGQTLMARLDTRVRTTMLTSGKGTVFNAEARMGLASMYPDVADIIDQMGATSREKHDQLVRAAGLNQGANVKPFDEVLDLSTNNISHEDLQGILAGGSRGILERAATIFDGSKPIRMSDKKSSFFTPSLDWLNSKKSVNTMGRQTSKLYEHAENTLFDLLANAGNEDYIFSKRSRIAAALSDEFDAVGGKKSFIDGRDKASRNMPVVGDYTLNPNQQVHHMSTMVQMLRTAAKEAGQEMSREEALDYIRSEEKAGRSAWAGPLMRSPLVQNQKMIMADVFSHEWYENRYRQGGFGSQAIQLMPGQMIISTEAQMYFGGDFDKDRDSSGRPMVRFNNGKISRAVNATDNKSIYDWAMDKNHPAGEGKKWMETTVFGLGDGEQMPAAGSERAIQMANDIVDAKQGKYRDGDKPRDVSVTDFSAKGTKVWTEAKAAMGLTYSTMRGMRAWMKFISDNDIAKDTFDTPYYKTTNASEDAVRHAYNSFETFTARAYQNVLDSQPQDEGMAALMGYDNGDDRNSLEKIMRGAGKDGNSYAYDARTVAGLFTELDENYDRNLEIVTALVERVRLGGKLSDNDMQHVGSLRSVVGYTKPVGDYRQFSQERNKDKSILPDAMAQIGAYIAETQQITSSHTPMSLNQFTDAIAQVDNYMPKVIGGNVVIENMQARLGDNEVTTQPWQRLENRKTEKQELRLGLPRPNTLIKPDIRQIEHSATDDQVIPTIDMQEPPPMEYNVLPIDYEDVAPPTDLMAINLTNSANNNRAIDNVTPEHVARRNQKRRLAEHEAGHALVNMLFGAPIQEWHVEYDDEEQKVKRGQVVADKAGLTAHQIALTNAAGVAGEIYNNDETTIANVDGNYAEGTDVSRYFNNMLGSKGKRPGQPLAQQSKKIKNQAFNAFVNTAEELSNVISENENLYNAIVDAMENNPTLDSTNAQEIAKLIPGAIVNEDGHIVLGSPIALPPSASLQPIAPPQIAQPPTDVQRTRSNLTNYNPNQEKNSVARFYVAMSMSGPRDAFAYLTGLSEAAETDAQRLGAGIEHIMFSTQTQDDNTARSRFIKKVYGKVFKNIGIDEDYSNSQKRGLSGTWEGVALKGSYSMESDKAIADLRLIENPNNETADELFMNNDQRIQDYDVMKLANYMVGSGKSQADVLYLDKNRVIENAMQMFSGMLGAKNLPENERRQQASNFITNSKAFFENVEKWYNASGKKGTFEDFHAGVLSQLFEGSYIGTHSINLNDAYNGYASVDEFRKAKLQQTKGVIDSIYEGQHNAKSAGDPLFASRALDTEVDGRKQLSIAYPQGQKSINAAEVVLGDIARNGSDEVLNSLGMSRNDARQGINAATVNALFIAEQKKKNILDIKRNAPVTREALAQALGLSGNYNMGREVAYHEAGHALGYTAMGATVAAYHIGMTGGAVVASGAGQGTLGYVAGVAGEMAMKGDDFERNSSHLDDIYAHAQLKRGIKSITDVTSEDVEAFYTEAAEFAEKINTTGIITHLVDRMSQEPTWANGVQSSKALNLPDGINIKYSSVSPVQDLLNLWLNGKTIVDDIQVAASGRNSAKKEAERSGINIADVIGTGKDGRVTIKDVQAHQAANTSPNLGETSVLKKLKERRSQQQNITNSEVEELQPGEPPPTDYSNDERFMSSGNQPPILPTAPPSDNQRGQNPSNPLFVESQRLYTGAAHRRVEMAQGRLDRVMNFASKNAPGGGDYSGSRDEALLTYLNNMDLNNMSKRDVALLKHTSQSLEVLRNSSFAAQDTIDTLNERENTQELTSVERSSREAARATISNVGGLLGVSETDDQGRNIYKPTTLGIIANALLNPKNSSGRYEKNEFQRAIGAYEVDQKLGDKESSKPKNVSMSDFANIEASYGTLSNIEDLPDQIKKWQNEIESGDYTNLDKANSVRQHLTRFFSIQEKANNSNSDHAQTIRNRYSDTGDLSDAYTAMFGANPDGTAVSQAGAAQSIAYATNIGKRQASIDKKQDSDIQKAIDRRYNNVERRTNEWNLWEHREDVHALVSSLDKEQELSVEQQVLMGRFGGREGDARQLSKHFHEQEAALGSTAQPFYEALRNNDTQAAESHIQLIEGSIASLGGADREKAQQKVDMLKGKLADFKDTQQERDDAEAIKSYKTLGREDQQKMRRDVLSGSSPASAGFAGFIGSQQEQADKKVNQLTGNNMEMAQLKGQLDAAPQIAKHLTELTTSLGGLANVSKIATDSTTRLSEAHTKVAEAASKSYADIVSTLKQLESVRGENPTADAILNSPPVSANWKNGQAIGPLGEMQTALFGENGQAGLFQVAVRQRTQDMLGTPAQDMNFAEKLSLLTGRSAAQVERRESAIKAGMYGTGIERAGWTAAALGGAVVSSIVQGHYAYKNIAKTFVDPAIQAGNQYRQAQQGQLMGDMGASMSDRSGLNSSSYFNALNAPERAMQSYQTQYSRLSARGWGNVQQGLAEAGMGGASVMANVAPVVGMGLAASYMANAVAPAIGGLMGLSASAISAVAPVVGVGVAGIAGLANLEGNIRGYDTDIVARAQRERQRRSETGFISRLGNNLSDITAAAAEGRNGDLVRQNALGYVTMTQMESNASQFKGKTIDPLSMTLANEQITNQIQEYQAGAAGVSKSQFDAYLPQIRSNVSTAFGISRNINAPSGTTSMLASQFTSANLAGFQTSDIMSAATTQLQSLQGGVVSPYGNQGFLGSVYSTIDMMVKSPEQFQRTMVAAQMGSNAQQSLINQGYSNFSFDPSKIAGSLTTGQGVAKVTQDINRIMGAPQREVSGMAYALTPIGRNYDGSGVQGGNYFDQVLAGSHSPLERNQLLGQEGAFQGITNFFGSFDSSMAGYRPTQKRWTDELLAKDRYVSAQSKMNAFSNLQSLGISDPTLTRNIARQSEQGFDTLGTAGRMAQARDINQYSDQFTNIVANVADQNTIDTTGIDPALKETFVANSRRKIGQYQNDQMIFDRSNIQRTGTGLNGLKAGIQGYTDLQGQYIQGMSDLQTSAVPYVSASRINNMSVFGNIQSAIESKNYNQANYLMEGAQFATNQMRGAGFYQTDQLASTANRVAQLDPTNRDAFMRAAGGDQYATSLLALQGKAPGWMQTVQMSINPGSLVSTGGGTAGMQVGYDDQINIFQAAARKSAGVSRGFVLGDGRYSVDQLSSMNQVQRENAGRSLEIESRNFGFAMERKQFTREASMSTYGQGLGAILGNSAFEGKGQYYFEDAQRNLSRRQEDYSMQQQGASLNIRGRGLENQFRQFFENFDLSKRKMEEGVGYQRTEMNIQHGQQRQEFGWQMQNMSYQRNMSELQFGFNMIDSEEDIRYSTGRQRRVAMRHRDQAVISHTMEMGHMDVEKDRAKERQKWEEERFEREKEHFEKGVNFQREEMELSKKHFLEDMALSREGFELEKKQYAMRFQFIAEERKLEDEQRAVTRAAHAVELAEKLQMMNFNQLIKKTMDDLAGAGTIADTEVRKANAALGYLVGTSQMLTALNPDMITLNNTITNFKTVAVEAATAIGSVLSMMTNAISVLQYQGNELLRIGTHHFGGGTDVDGEGYADGGVYTGNGLKHEPAKNVNVHRGEYVVPQGGALVNMSPEQIAILKQIHSVLTEIKENGGNAVINVNTGSAEGMIRQGNSIYRKALGRA